MPVLISRTVRINGEVRQSSTVLWEGLSIKRVQLPICIIEPPLMERAEIEVEISFDPPLGTEGSGE